MVDHVADNVAVVQALGEQTAMIVGHDWGSTIAANTALLRPDVFTAVGLLSVPYAPRNGYRDWEDLDAWDGAPITQCPLHLRERMFDDRRYGPAVVPI